MGRSTHSKHGERGTWHADVRTVRRGDVAGHMGQDSKLVQGSKPVRALGSKPVRALGSKLVRVLGSKLGLARGSIPVLELGSKQAERNANGAS